MVVKYFDKKKVLVEKMKGIKLKNKFIIILVILFFFYIRTITSCTKNNVGDDMILKQKEILFDFQIFSTPVIWKDKNNNEWFIAFISGESGRITGLQAFLPTGKSVRRFPLMRDRFESGIPPLNQISVADINDDNTEEIVTIDFAGHIFAFNNSGSIISGFPSEKGIKDAVQIWQPLYNSIGIQQLPGFILTTINAGPKFSSDNTFSIIDKNGNYFLNYPKRLSSTPLNKRPILIKDKNDAIVKAFILLESGDIDGFDLNQSARLPEFPINIISNEDSIVKNTNYINACLVDDLNMIVISTGRSYLTLLDYNNYKLTKMHVEGTSMISRVFCLNGILYALDEKNNTILKLNKNGKILNCFKIELESGFINDYFNGYALNYRKENLLFLIYSSKNEFSSTLDKIFDENSPPGEANRIEKRVYDMQLKWNKKKKLTPLQLRESASLVENLKENYLIEKFGEEQYKSMINPAIACRILMIEDFLEKQKMKVYYDDYIKLYSSSVNIGLSTNLYPKIFTDVQSSILYFIVPLNYFPGSGEVTNNLKSMIKIIKIPI